MEFVRMNECHVDAIAKLEVQCFSDPWTRDAIMSEVNNPLSLWVVAIDGEQLAGYVGSQSVLGWADMMNLAVAPEYRRQRIGKGLIEELITRLKDIDVTQLSLEVRASNEPAIALYEKMGFAQVGRRPNYYFHPKEDALILRKEWQI